MPTTLDEGQQRYTFSDNWLVERYDNQPVHKKMMSCLTGIKGVDFVGLYRGDVYLIEIKDYRGYRIQNKTKLKTGELAEDIALKVLHSIPGLTAESRSASDSVRAKTGLNSPKHPIKLFVVLHIEDDTAVNLLAWKQQMDTQARLIEKNLAWLPCRVVVTSRTPGLRVPDVDVTNLAKTAP